MGIQTVDVRKQIVAMAKIDKQLQIIGKGAMAREQHVNANTAISRNQSLSEIGGSDSAFSFNVADALNNAMVGARKEFNALNAQKNQIINNKDLSESSKATSLATLQ